MRGEIQITFKLDGVEVAKLQPVSNLVVDGAGQVIADALSISPSLSSIESASAILDASNYTIQAISFGKDASGYGQHAHNKDLSTLVLADGVIRVFSQQTTNVSSYQPSGASGVGLPEYPHPLNTRLETCSTAPWFTTLDVGHNLNMIPTSGVNGYGLSSLMIGCYPTSGSEGTKVAIVSSLNGANPPIASGIMYSMLNANGAMDQSGFITMTVSSVKQGNTKTLIDWAKGLIMAADTDFSSLGPVKYRVALSAGDFGMPNVFGGIYHMGLWCLDIKTMLENGITPPFSFSPINNPRRYRLFAKKTFLQDLTWGIDHTGGILGTVFGQSISPRQQPAFQFNEMYIEWRLRF